MDHADLTLNLLSENDRVQARLLALELESKNNQRQKITQEIYNEVQASLNPAEDYKLIVRSGKNWPLGVVGVVAGKIADEYSCPTFILRQNENGKLLEGSGRSIDKFDLIRAVGKIDDLLEKYGGHSQAMGIKIKPKNLAQFQKKLLKLINLSYNKYEWGNKISADAQIEPGDIDWDLISEIRKFEPFGEANEEPVFVSKGFRIESVSKIGNGQKHLKLVLSTGGKMNKKLEAIFFKGAEKMNDLKIGEKISLVYNLRSNEWNGSHRIDLNVLHIFRL